MPVPAVPTNAYSEKCYEWLVYFAQIAYTKPQPGRSWIHAVTEAVREEMLGFSPDPHDSGLGEDATGGLEDALRQRRLVKFT